MIATRDFLVRTRLDAETLEAWVDAGWLLPRQNDEAERFSDVDLARAKLIRDLQTDLGVNDEGIMMILDLVDQVHGLRRTLRELLSAIHARSEPIRRRITAESSTTRRAPYRAGDRPSQELPPSSGMGRIRATSMMGRPLVDAEALRRLHFLNRLQSVILLVGLLALAAATGAAARRHRRPSHSGRPRRRLPDPQPYVRRGRDPIRVRRGPADASQRPGTGVAGRRARAAGGPRPCPRPVSDSHAAICRPWLPAVARRRRWRSPAACSIGSRPVRSLPFSRMRSRTYVTTTCSSCA